MKILKFYATWCNPCKYLTKNLEEAHIEHTPVNIDEEEALVEKYGIRSVPTLVILNDSDTEVGRLLGPMTKESLITSLAKFQEL